MYDTWFSCGPFAIPVGPLLGCFQATSQFSILLLHVPAGGGCVGLGEGWGEVGGVALHGVVILCLYIIKKLFVCVCVCFYFLAMATHVPHIHAPSIISLGFKMVSNYE